MLHFATGEEHNTRKFGFGLVGGTIALWIIAFITRSADQFDRVMPFLGDVMARRGLLSVLGAASCYPLAQLYGAVQNWRLSARVAVALAGSLVAGLLYAEAYYIAYFVIDPRWGAASASGGQRALVEYITQPMVWTYAAWSGAYFAFEYGDTVRRQQQRLIENQALFTATQNKMLRYQLNPHFIFNALNAISALVLRNDNVTAERTILALSEFIRHSLISGPDDSNSIADEIDLQLRYLSIEKIRFGPRLSVESTVAPNVKDFQVPSLILQPLVENAVKYGADTAMGVCTIEITAVRSENDAKIVVRNSLPKSQRPANARNGIGLDNVRRRLKAAFGSAATLRCQELEGKSFVATVSITMASL